MELSGLYFQADRQYRTGDMEGAAALYARIMQLDAGKLAPRYMLGIIRAQQDRIPEALVLLESALSLEPDNPVVLASYGNVLSAAGRLDEALASCERASAADRGFPEAEINRGTILFRLGRFEEAVASCDAVLELDRRNAIAWNNRSFALRVLGRFDEALASCDQALAVDPRFIDALNNRGVILTAMKRFDEALRSLGSALEVNPVYPDALANRSLIHLELRQLKEGLRDSETAIARDDQHAEAWNARGAILRGLGRIDAALASYDRALAIQPRLAQALLNRAGIHWLEKHDYESAIADLEAAHALEPGLPYLLGFSLLMRMHGADWRDFDDRKRLIDDLVREGRGIASPYEYQAISDSPSDLQLCSRQFARDKFPVPQDSMPPAKTAHRKIRVGYMSGEFREQATAYLMAGLYEAHDRGRFEVIAIDSDEGDQSVMRRRLEAAFDGWISIAGLSDRAAAEKIRVAEIDILINLNGYFGIGRMGVFAHRPAPLQVNYLGFPATLGAPYIDYIIADRVVIPDDEQMFYDEAVIYLPECYQANDSRRPIAEGAVTRSQHGLPDDAFVFCNFNQGFKHTPHSFSVWMNVVRRVNGSVLWLQDGPPAYRENLRREAVQRGVNPDRLVFAPVIAVAQHLARIRLADLFLDSLPYNAHTTASDALWAGLPLLTCRGKSFAGRVAASLLMATDLPELVTETVGEFEDRAVRLATDRLSLQTLRSKLAENRRTCRLFDTARFTAHFETALSMMWQIYCRGEAPRAFAVPPIGG